MLKPLNSSFIFVVLLVIISHAFVDGNHFSEDGNQASDIIKYLASTTDDHISLSALDSVDVSTEGGGLMLIKSVLAVAPRGIPQLSKEIIATGGVEVFGPITTSGKFHTKSLRFPDNSQQSTAWNPDLISSSKKEIDKIIFTKSRRHLLGSSSDFLQRILLTKTGQVALPGAFVEDGHDYTALDQEKFSFAGIASPTVCVQWSDGSQSYTAFDSEGFNKVLESVKKTSDDMTNEFRNISRVLKYAEEEHATLGPLFVSDGGNVFIGEKLNLGAMPSSFRHAILTVDGTIFANELIFKDNTTQTTAFPLNHLRDEIEKKTILGKGVLFVSSDGVIIDSTRRITKAHAALDVHGSIRISNGDHTRSGIIFGDGSTQISAFNEKYWIEQMQQIYISFSEGKSLNKNKAIFINSENSNVGIQIPNPKYSLQISGIISLNGIQFPDSNVVQMSSFDNSIVSTYVANQKLLNITLMQKINEMEIAVKNVVSSSSKSIVSSIFEIDSFSGKVGIDVPLDKISHKLTIGYGLPAAHVRIMKGDNDNHGFIFSDGTMQTIAYTNEHVDKLLSSASCIGEDTDLCIGKETDGGLTIVGIGTVAPMSKFHVVGTVRIEGVHMNNILQTTSYDDAKFYESIATLKEYSNKKESFGRLNKNDMFISKDNGKVGIGTHTPLKKLSVMDQLFITGKLLLSDGSKQSTAYVESAVDHQFSSIDRFGVSNRCSSKTYLEQKSRDCNIININTHGNVFVSEFPSDDSKLGNAALNVHGVVHTLKGLHFGSGSVTNINNNIQVTAYDDVAFHKALESMQDLASEARSVGAYGTGLTVYRNGNVGINVGIKNMASCTLDVNGIIRTGFLSFNDTSEQATAFSNERVIFMLSNSNVIGNGVLYINPKSLNVGIHTASPQSPLTVNGVIAMESSGLLFPDGTRQLSAFPSRDVTLRMTRILQTVSDIKNMAISQNGLSSASIGARKKAFAIGTSPSTDPSGPRLTVQGSIRVQSGVVFPSGTQTTAFLSLTTTDFASGVEDFNIQLKAKISQVVGLGPNQKLLRISPQSKTVSIGGDPTDLKDQLTVNGTLSVGKSIVFGNNSKSQTVAYMGIDSYHSLNADNNLIIGVVNVDSKGQVGIGNNGIDGYRLSVTGNTIVDGDIMIENNGKVTHLSPDSITNIKDSRQNDSQMLSLLRTLSDLHVMQGRMLRTLEQRFQKSQKLRKS